MPEHRTRCPWPGGDELMLEYHDREWGVPVHEDRRWFECIVLDAFQAGLSWKTVLHKRDAFRKVFFGFDPSRIAAMTKRQVDAACRNPAIIRNRLKIEAAIQNARKFLELQKEHGSFDAFVWSFTAGQVIHNSWESVEQVPASTPLSDQLSGALKKKGFSFVGSTICYAFLQAGGIVNDHVLGCFRHHELRSNP